MDTAAELFFGDCGKPSLDQVEPAGRGGREVQVKARPSGQPVADPGGLMGSVVVQNYVHIQFGRHVVSGALGRTHSGIPTACGLMR